MKKLLLLLLIITLLLSMTACSGYNGIMREHLGNEDNIIPSKQHFLHAFML
jgi:hypothetical protein